MVDEAQAANNESEEQEVTDLVAPGAVSSWLSENQYPNEALAADHLEVEMIKIEPESLLSVSQALHEYGFNYLQCQGAYDLGPGKELVSFYHLIKVDDDSDRPEEVRVNVFLPRENPQLPSVYWIWKGADWQERESYDMYGIIYEGHPNLKRILMPEDWVGWPMRKDYISPDFFELQDAY